MSNLKPCPFCGGEAIFHDCLRPPETFPCRVYCDNCWAEVGGYSTKAEAIAAWNTRIEHVSDDGWEYDKYNVPATDENMAKFGWVRERTCTGMLDYDSWFICSNCGCQTKGDQYGEKPNYCASCGCKVVDE